MALLCVLFYIALISTCGCFFLRRWKIDPILLFFAGFMIGSVFMGVGMFLLVSIKYVTPISVGILTAVMLILGVFGASTMFRSLKGIKCFLFSHVYAGKYRLVLLIILLIGLVLYLADAYSPPRDGDAMRYHLAQMKETVRDSGFVFRPYYHHNFPQYFHYLFIPTYMLAGGVSVNLAVYLFFILTVLATLYLSFKTKQTKQLLLLALFFVFMPISVRQSTIAANDFPVTLYGLIGLLLIINFEEKPQVRYLIFAYISFGFALGCKYQAIFYFPLYMWATLLVIRRWQKSYFDYAAMLPLSIIPFLIASPFFIRNLYYTGDPFWPMLQDLFHVQKNYLYHVIQVVSLGDVGRLGFTELTRSILRLATFQQIVPFIWILWLGYYFTHCPSGMFYKVGSLLYFCIWFLIQPRIIPRYIIYPLPIIIIMGIAFCEWLYNKHSKTGKVMYATVLISILIGIGFSVFYSLDFLKYHVTHDIKQYHQFTQYYEQQQWLNQNLKDDGKVLVIVGAGQTYYIDKENLLASPELSGLIDWTAIQNVKELRDILRRLQVRYILYDDRDWSAYPGGSNMMHLISNLKKEKDVSVLMEDKNVKLFYLRILRKFFTTRVFVLDLQGGIEESYI